MKQGSLLAFLVFLCGYVMAQLPPQANVQYQPYMLNKYGKDVIVTDINEAGDVSGWVEDDNVQPVAFHYKNSGPISERWTMFEAGGSATRVYNILAAGAVVGTKKVTNRYEGMRWWLADNSLGYSGAVVDVAPGDYNVRDYEVMAGKQTTPTDYMVFGNATVMKRFPVDMSGKTEERAVKQVFIKTKDGYAWLPNARARETNAYSGQISGKNRWTHVLGGSAIVAGKRWPAYWFSSQGTTNYLDPARWTGIALTLENGEGQINSVGYLRDQCIGVGHYTVSKSHAWMYGIFEATSANWRLNQFQNSDASEAFDCIPIAASTGLPYDFIIVGNCGGKAVKWELQSAEGVRSNRIVDLFTVMNQRLYDGLTISNAVAVNSKGQILCQGNYQGHKVGVILTPKQ